MNNSQTFIPHLTYFLFIRQTNVINVIKFIKYIFLVYLTG
jgi:hypothetical protein